MKRNIARAALVVTLITGIAAWRFSNRTSANATVPRAHVQPVPAEDEPFDPARNAQDSVQRVEASGAFPASPLTDGTKQLFDAWRRQAKPELSANVEFEQVHCFQSGCYMRGLYESAEQLEAMTLDFYSSTLFGDFPANVGRSAPLVFAPSGAHRVSAIWFITPPPEGFSGLEPAGSGVEHASTDAREGLVAECAQKRP